MANTTLAGGNAPSKTLTLALITPGVSPELAATITDYAADVNAYNADENAACGDFDNANLILTTRTPARSFDDIAAKLALAMFELRAGETIAPDQVLLKDEHSLDKCAEDLFLSALADARRLGQSLDRSDFEAGLAEYRAKRAYSDMTPDDDDEADRNVDAYCESMDFLVEKIPAPDIAAVITKFELSIERWDGFELHENYARALLADLKRLAGLEA